MIEVNNVTFRYSGEAEEDIAPALAGVTLRIDEGETIALIGHNGSGKSTLARLLAAILLPQQGSVIVDGLRTDAGGESLWQIRQTVGLVFQNPDDQLVANTVIDEIAFGPENLGLPRFEIEERVEEVLDLLDLRPHAHRAVSDLSQGQKQRLAVAGVLAMRPRYLILDEPTTMIPGRTAEQLLETVRRLARERGISVLHITHHMHELVDFDRVIVMDRGRVLLDGTPANVLRHREELERAGLGLPLITQLGQRLRARGWSQLPEVLLTLDDLKAALCSLK
ncbi:ATP-binding cassette domain-containing protein [Thermogemmatispora sp.]|uniref:ATP-binding cassette domain-containing protein n=1 Tax=Thermogemmatispora sp. TaxID=1968838 RepID=UPI001DF0302E|nr:ATP-binding cassette domain-containing protein [Thermogemmatispora sp.]MBX5450624.1 ATP-binding cassette domain-containing protein [Thermogemmatispora sp.]